MKILLVEDDPYICDIYVTKFTAEGFEIKIAVDGEECLEKIKLEKPDLILLDIVLPNTDGWEVLRKIKEDDNLQSIKVIVLSNLGQKEEIEKGIKMGAEGYLIKSQYTPSEIVKEVKRILNIN